MSKSTKKFKTDVQKLLDIVINSLYSKKEIFLRELISNASDAIDRLRFEALTNHDLLKDGEEPKIKLAFDKNARTITITDNGIGMNREEIEENIGTIANSGTRKFLEQLQGAKDTTNLELIGQFGVGFYASFMVSDKVTLITKRAGGDQTAFKWQSEGAGSYTIEDIEKENHGTEITLHLREDMDDYLEEWRLRSIVKEYSDFISYPIVMDTIKKEKKSENDDTEVETVSEETLNSMKAIWKRPRNEITAEEYNEFYKHISHDFKEPLDIIHYSAEGTLEFKALLYIPSQAPFDMFMPGAQRGLHLYVKNVFIADDYKELLPEYLRFVRGVVDSSDLPLNISREMLQDDIILKKIRKSIVGKILNTLIDLKEKEYSKYKGFYDNFGRVLKEGLNFQYDNQDKLKELLLFASTKTAKDQLTSLKEYTARMPERQKDIYYITGESYETVANSPLLEVFKGKDYEVLFLIDPIDEFITQSVNEYDSKKLKPVHKGELKFDSESESKEKEQKTEEAGKEYESLMKFILKKLEDDIKDVKISARLIESPCCLVADEHGMDPNMERIMKALNKDVGPSKRILELNPNHPLMNKLKELHSKDEDNPRLADYVEMLRDQALLTEGSAPKNPAKFARLVSELMLNAN